MNHRQPTNHRHFTDMTFHRHTDTALYVKGRKVSVVVSDVKETL
jgi:hypothetical protein